MVSPVLLVAVPLGLAFCVPLFGLLSRKAARFVPIVACLFNLVVSVRLLPAALEEPLVASIGGFSPPFCITLFAGPVGLLLSALVALAGLVVSIYAIAYIDKGPTTRYHTLYLLLLVGATGVVLTGDIFNLFVFFEILCISSYALVAYVGDRGGLEAAAKYLIQGAVGSALLLLGIGLLYGLTGTLNMADIAGRIGSISSVSVFVPMALIVVGLGVEAAIFPLNAWLPDAHSSAPSTISAILSGIAIEVGLYAVIRVVFTVFGASSVLLFLVFLGVLTLLVGEMCAFAQSNIKRMLAYSSIGQIGLIVFAVSLATTGSVAGGLFQLISHTLSKVVLFLAVGYMIYRSGSTEISSLEGMGKRMPLTSLAFTVAAFSLVGLPPFAGFPSKFLIVRAAVLEQGTLFLVLIGLVLVGTVIEGAYFFRVVQTIYFRKRDESPPKHDAPTVALVPMFLVVALIIAIGVYPDAITGVLNSAAAELIERTHYIRSVLG
jgi:proton-translocating NADH-quinone oxidoreductase chain N